MRTRLLLFSIALACALGCAREGEPDLADLAASEAEPEPEPRENTGDPDREGCEIVCASYDPTDCREICPPEPPDASVPDDPYAQ